MSNRLVHKSAGNASNRFRRVFMPQYSAKPLTRNAAPVGLAVPCTCRAGAIAPTYPNVTTCEGEMIGRPECRTNTGWAKLEPFFPSTLAHTHHTSTSSCNLPLSWHWNASTRYEQILQSPLVNKKKKWMCGAVLQRSRRNRDYWALCPYTLQSDTSKMADDRCIPFSFLSLEMRNRSKPHTLCLLGTQRSRTRPSVVLLCWTYWRWSVPLASNDYGSCTLVIKLEYQFCCCVLITFNRRIAHTKEAFFSCLSTFQRTILSNRQR